MKVWFFALVVIVGSLVAVPATSSAQVVVRVGPQHRPYHRHPYHHHRAFYYRHGHRYYYHR